MKAKTVQKILKIFNVDKLFQIEDNRNIIVRDSNDSIQTMIFGVRGGKLTDSEIKQLVAIANIDEYVPQTKACVYDGKVTLYYV